MGGGGGGGRGVISAFLSQFGQHRNFPERLASPPLLSLNESPPSGKKNQKANKGLTTGQTEKYQFLRQSFKKVTILADFWRTGTRTFTRARAHTHTFKAK